MDRKKKDITLLIVLIIILLAINYPFLDNALKDFLIDYRIVQVERVIDGDTIVSNGTSIRLLGINSPERGELYYNEAKVFLEELVFNQTVRLEFGKERTDKYNRTLAYIFLNDQNINLQLVENGYANIYFYGGKDKYSNDLESAWEECIDNNINLCEASSHQCSECIELKEFNHNSQTIVLYNNCDIQCDLTDWTIKDEGRKKFAFPSFILDAYSSVEIIVGEGVDINNELYWTGEDYVWTRTGDSLFLRDADGKLVLWGSY